MLPDKNGKLEFIRDNGEPQPDTLKDVTVPLFLTLIFL